MIRSTAAGSSEASWNDHIHRSNEASNTFTSAFSSMSISSSIPGNRPPALSTSSISSYGEDAPISSSSNKIFQDNILAYTPASPLTPSSSLNYFSHSGASSSFSPGFHGNNSSNQEDAPSRLPLIQSTSQDASAVGMKLEGSIGSYESNSTKNNGFQDTLEKKDNSIWNTQHSSNKYTSATNYSHNFIGSWTPSEKVLMSPGTKSLNSISNMGSVDENEEYHGNRVRARTLPAVTDHHNNMQRNYGHEQDSPVGSNGDINYINSSTGYVSSSSNHHFCDIPHSNSIPENLAHPYSNRLEMSTNMNGHIGTSRQRIMSADNVNQQGLAGRNMFSSYETLPRNPSTSSNILHGQRSRSHSSSATYGRSSQHPFFDHPPSMNIHGFDNRFPPSMMPSIPQKMLNNEDSTILIIPSLSHPIRSNSISSIESQHYFHGMIGASSSRVVYTVKFKRSQRNFTLSPHIQGNIKIGTYVKVEADRGHDLGIVLSRVPIEKFSKYGSDDTNSRSTLPDMKKIISVASNEEITLLQLKKEEEDELLKICRSKAIQKGLTMNIVDAEYQFDRHKLTFFFEAEGRIDFRELVRELFSIYKTRIWMQQIDKDTTVSSALSSDFNFVPTMKQGNDVILSEKSTTMSTVEPLSSD